VTARERILLFDWAPWGHHPVYIQRFVEAVESRVDITVAAPREAVEQFDGISPDLYLTPARPVLDYSRRWDECVRLVKRQELALMQSAIASASPSKTVHLFADTVLPSLAIRRRLPTSLSLLIFRPRLHYPRDYGTPLSVRQYGGAVAHEAAVTLWRRRPDALSVLTLDPLAADRWNRRAGAPAVWLPEPFVCAGGLRPTFRDIDVLLFGTIDRRKGFDGIAEALRAVDRPLNVRLAGTVAKSYVNDLYALIAGVQAHGHSVRLDDRRHTPQEGLELLARARCTAVTYRNHFGMSRVLLEAAAAQTPCLATDRGQIGWLVRKHHLGIATNPDDPRRTATALRSLLEDRWREQPAFVKGCRELLAAHSRASTTRAVLEALALAPRTLHS
jgi:glycosyltransferase involved in cell wall biosynthesis